MRENTLFSTTIEHCLLFRRQELRRTTRGVRLVGWESLARVVIDG
jgi:hypothetical protein